MKFEISDVGCLVKLWVKTFRLARKAPNISGRNSGQISANISETSFQISRLFSETSFSRRGVLISAGKRSGRERKGPPEIIQKFRLRKRPISSADFPVTPLERAEHHVGPFWGEGFWGNIRRPLLLPAPLFYC